MNVGQQYQNRQAQPQVQQRQPMQVQQKKPIVNKSPIIS